MAKRKSNGDGRENTSFSLRSSTIETLESFLIVMEENNKSSFVDEAIREKIGREISSNPLSFRQLSAMLGGLAS